MGCVSSSPKSASTREEDDVFDVRIVAISATTQCSRTDFFDCFQAESPPPSAGASAKKPMQRSKSLVVKEKRMRRTKSAVYEKGMEEQMEKDAISRRT